MVKSQSLKTSFCGVVAVVIFSWISAPKLASSSEPQSEHDIARGQIQKWRAHVTTRTPPFTANYSVKRIGLKDLATVTCDNAHGTAVIALRGAHLLSWVPRHAQSLYFEQAPHPSTRPNDIFWLSSHSGRNNESRIRGGIPLVGPWFGQNPWGASGLPIHGFLRTSLFEMSLPRETINGTALDFRLPHEKWRSQVPRDWWPDDRGKLDFEVTVDMGQSLNLQQKIHNVGDHAVDIEAGFHPYFLTPDVRNTKVTDLQKKNFVDRAQGSEQSRLRHASPRFGGEVDSLFLDTHDKQLTISMLRRNIVLEQLGNHQTVIWNPGLDTPKTHSLVDVNPDEVTNFLCVEPMVTRPKPKTLKPGESHYVGMNISVLIP